MLNITDNIYAVGAVDSKVRIFHGYQTPVGTTYNAYLVLDDEITLIDFVKASFADVLLANIREVLGDRRIDRIICNHVEPDHSGALPAVTAAYPEAVLYGTAACEKELRAYYPDSRYTFVPVKAGDTLCTGRYTFSFIPMPMVHWPDSMSTYLAAEALLFSNDALGQHIGSGERFDSELPVDRLLERAGDYYANIVLPYGAPVQRLLAALSGLAIETVCPAHGVVLRGALPQMLAKYADWGAGKVDERRVAIVYDTMWGTTAKMARALEAEYAGNGFSVECISLSERHYSHAMARLLEAKYIFVGSPTLNNTYMPTVSAFLTYMKGLKPKDRTGMAFGAYGWSGESVPQINDFLAACGFEMLPPRKAMWNL